ncbi:TP901 family phage tail tape measure protein [Prauserella sediminis]|uniref:TP901 family phage tail tape measure protein n=1 Tax=Prauserella sediminis TaxID=577680 RepID=A0A839XX57_9PSEU|nr:phage tail tape measure protein [Prauserella sediminis]MBB3665934.1 TP901 family phage tail tape measure protein [Prauserella sediminis]
MPSGGAVAQAVVELTVDGSNVSSEVRSAMSQAGNAAQSAAAETGQQAGRSLSQGMSDSLQSAGGRMQAVGQTLTKSVTLPLAGVGATALKMSGDFQASMNKVSAISGATGGELAKMEDLAKQMGSTTQFSASEAADAMTYLSMAGFDTSETMKALPDTMNLAAAGGLNLADAADIASNVLSGYGMQAADLGKVNDALAKTFTSTNTDMRMLGESFKMVAPVASSAGLEFNEVSSAIGLLGNAGIQGSEAGTALRSSIAMLLNPSAQAQKTLKKLGVSAVDSSGNLKSLTSIVGQLEKSGASTADMMTIFGQEAGPAMSALVGQGSSALKDLTKELNNSGGTAEKIAGKQMEGFNGSMKQLKSAFEGLMISIGQSGLLDFMTSMVSGLTGLISKLNEASPTTMKVVTAIGALVAAIGPVTWALGTMTSGVGRAIGMFAKLGKGVLAMGKAIRVAGVAFKAFGAILRANPIGLVITAIGLLVTAFITLWNRSAAFREFWIGLWNGIKGAVSAVVTWFQTTVLPIFTAVANWITARWNQLAAWWSNLWNSRIGGVIRRVLAVIGAAIRASFNSAMSVIRGAMTAIKGVISGAWNAIKSVVKGALTVIRGIISTVLGVITGNWTAAWNGIKTVASGIWNAIKGVVTGALSAIRGVISGALSTIKGVWTSAWNGLKSVVTTAWNGIKGGVQRGISAVLGFIRGLPGKIMGFFSGAGTWLLQAGKNIISGLIDGIKSMIGSIGDAIGNVAGKIRDFLPFSPAKEGPLSGGGAPENSGAAISRNIAKGMSRGVPQVRRAVRKVAGAVSADVPAVPSPALLAAGQVGGRRTPEMAHAERTVHALTRNSQITRSMQRQVTVNAPITMQSAAQDPEIAAARIHHRVTALAQA